METRQNTVRYPYCNAGRTVLGDVVEVVPADDEGAVHFGGDDLASQDTATDGDVASEGALLVCADVREHSSLSNRTDAPM